MGERESVWKEQRMKVGERDEWVCYVLKKVDMVEWKQIYKKKKKKKKKMEILKEWMW